MSDHPITPRKVILPKMGLAEINSKIALVTKRLDVVSWSTKRFDGRNNNNNNNNNNGPVDRGGRKRVIPTLQAWALRDRRKGDPNASVVGKIGA